MDKYTDQWDQKTIRRYLSQRCIGYARDIRGIITASILESAVEYTDGSRAIIREYYPALHFRKNDHLPIFKAS